MITRNERGFADDLRQEVLGRLANVVDRYDVELSEAQSMALHAARLNIEAVLAAYEPEKCGECRRPL